MTEYRVCTHAEVPDADRLISALSDLERITFSHYDGVVPATPAFMRWYTSRPGMRGKLCQAVFAGEQLVSSVFVTLATMRLGGEILQCGIVDTVMTHPEHRRRGLASTLLGRALEAMQAEGGDVSLLYTARSDPPLPPERLYRRLGYLPREGVARLLRAASAEAGRAEPAHLVGADEGARLRFERALGRRDGWLRLDGDLWRWRRLARPCGYPASLCFSESGAAAAICTGELFLSGRAQPTSVISDLVLPAGEGAKEAFRALVAAAPGSAPVTLLCPQSEARLCELAVELGFSLAGLEVAMLRPLTDRGRQAMERPRGDWYVAVESVVGV